MFGSVCVPTVSKAEKKDEDGREKLSCQSLAGLESLQADSQRPAWGVVVSESVDDLSVCKPLQQIVGILLAPERSPQLSPSPLKLGASLSAQCWT